MLVIGGSVSSGRDEFGINILGIRKERMFDKHNETDLIAIIILILGGLGLGFSVMKSNRIVLYISVFLISAGILIIFITRSKKR